MSPHLLSEAVCLWRSSLHIYSAGKPELRHIPSVKCRGGQKVAVRASPAARISPY